MNTKLNPHRFWHCDENGLIKTIQMIPHNQDLSLKLTSLYCGLRIRSEKLASPKLFRALNFITLNFSSYAI